jgi:hypothetical protein
MSEVAGGGETWADAEKCPESAAAPGPGPVRGGMFGQGCALLLSGAGAGR